MPTKSDKDADDSEDINDSYIPDDVTSIFEGIGFNNFKIAIFLFILFILLTSDVFIDRVLSTKDGSYTDGRNVNGKGAVAQGLLLSIGYIAINTLVSCECI